MFLFIFNKTKILQKIHIQEIFFLKNVKKEMAVFYKPPLFFIINIRYN